MEDQGPKISHEEPTPVSNILTYGNILSFLCVCCAFIRANKSNIKLRSEMVGIAAQCHVISKRLHFSLTIYCLYVCMYTYVCLYLGNFHTVLNKKIAIIFEKIFYAMHTAFSNDTSLEV